MKNIILNHEKRERVVFHFNKAHLADIAIPMWVLKHKGKSYYVDHVDFEKGIGFSTKETPENLHTKGSLMIRGRLEIYQKNDKTYGRVF